MADQLAADRLLPDQPTGAADSAHRGRSYHERWRRRARLRQAWPAERWHRDGPGRLPLVIALFQVVGVTLVALAGSGGGRPPGPTAYALLAASGLTLYGIRRFPVLTMLGTFVLTAGYLALHLPSGPYFLAPVIATVAAVIAGNRPAAWSVIVVVVAAQVTTQFAVTGSLSGRGNLLLVAIVGVALLAEVLRSNRDRMMERRRRRVGDERLLMAREVHDVVAHHISLINVQAGVALHLIDDDPQQARTALAAIKVASRDTLRELRATLGVLRGVDEQAPRSPAPSVTSLDELLGRLDAAGLHVSLVVTGTPRTLPTAVDLAAYRIVQESLTNVHRHAQTDTARVTIGYQPDELVLDVTDAGRGGLVSEGNGLSGIRERIAALGGTVAIGPRPEGGFTVCAVLPLAPEPDTAPAAVTPAAEAPAGESA